MTPNHEPASGSLILSAVEQTVEGAIGWVASLEASAIDESDKFPHV